MVSMVVFLVSEIVFVFFVHFFHLANNFVGLPDFVEGLLVANAQFNKFTAIGFHCDLQGRLDHVVAEHVFHHVQHFGVVFVLQCITHTGAANVT